jgi:hypothetical protein
MGRIKNGVATVLSTTRELHFDAQICATVSSDIQNILLEMFPRTEEGFWYLGCGTHRRKIRVIWIFNEA